MGQLFAFNVLGTDQRTVANNINHAKELLLLKACGIDSSNGYWEDDLKGAKATELGKVFWNSIKDAKPTLITSTHNIEKKQFSVRVRRLEWNHYEMTVPARSEHLAQEKVRQQIHNDDFSNATLIKPNAEPISRNGYKGPRIVQVKQLA